MPRREQPAATVPDDPRGGALSLFDEPTGLDGLVGLENFGERLQAGERPLAVVTAPLFPGALSSGEGALNSGDGGDWGGPGLLDQFNGSPLDLLGLATGGDSSLFQRPPAALSAPADRRAEHSPVSSSPPQQAARRSGTPPAAPNAPPAATSPGPDPKTSPTQPSPPLRPSPAQQRPPRMQQRRLPFGLPGGGDYSQQQLHAVGGADFGFPDEAIGLPPGRNVHGSAALERARQLEALHQSQQLQRLQEQQQLYQLQLQQQIQQLELANAMGVGGGPSRGLLPGDFGELGGLGLGMDAGMGPLPTAEPIPDAQLGLGPPPPFAQALADPGLAGLLPPGVEQLVASGMSLEYALRLQGGSDFLDHPGLPLSATGGLPAAQLQSSSTFALQQMLQQQQQLHLPPQQRPSRAPPRPRAKAGGVGVGHAAGVAGGLGVGGVGLAA
eukprot:Hpha_TRINITY_DN15709_c5_g12::TRINITY_DN15709_c5_g12_i1::g.37354::m.37354